MTFTWPRKHSAAASLFTNAAHDADSADSIRDGAGQMKKWWRKK